MEGYFNKQREGTLDLNSNTLKELENLIQKSSKKRMTFLIAITKSSRAISDGAKQWFESEKALLVEEMNILKNIVPEEVQDWQKQLDTISKRFETAISYLDAVIDKAEKGKVTAMREVYTPKEKETFELPPLPLTGEKEEEKKLDLVSAILEVFDSASSLEKLINEVEKQCKRITRTVSFIIKAVEKKQK
jgi:hypothetical protein